MTTGQISYKYATLLDLKWCKENKLLFILNKKRIIIFIFWNFAFEVLALCALLEHARPMLIMLESLSSAQLVLADISFACLQFN